MSSLTQSSIRVGLNKGYPSARDEKLREAIKSRPSRRKGRSSKKVDVVREVIREVAGLAPYEKRVLDILKTGGANAEKRTYKFAKQRLGTHTRAVAKRKEIQAYYGKLRAKASA